MRHRYTHRRRPLWPVIAIVLVVATAASITALFMRGFRWHDYAAQIHNQEISTPAIQSWLLVVPEYNDKMAAYKAGLAAEKTGTGVYVRPENNQWSWVAGVYPNEDEAKAALEQTDIPAQARVQLYSIQSKQFSLAPEALEPCQQILNSIQNVYQLLLNLRAAVNTDKDTNNLQLEITTQYNQMKAASEYLQGLNANLKSDFIATVIYSANQNILGLQKIIGVNQPLNLSIVNNALLKTIFSLDNF